MKLQTPGPSESLGFVSKLSCGGGAAPPLLRDARALGLGSFPRSRARGQRFGSGSRSEIAEGAAALTLVRLRILREEKFASVSIENQ